MTAQRSRFGLDRQGMHHLGTVHWNLPVPVLCEHAVRRREGELALGGSFSVSTGSFTGRTPRDKYIVEEAGTKETVAWGKINQPVSAGQFASLHQIDRRKLLDYVMRHRLAHEAFAKEHRPGEAERYFTPDQHLALANWLHETGKPFTPCAVCAPALHSVLKSQGRLRFGAQP